jgi:hypothetical protein
MAEEDLWAISGVSWTSPPSRRRWPYPPLGGECCDLEVRGQCIAKGEVVVIDENFEIRVTEVLRKEG